MRVLFTGASSTIGSRVLLEMLKSPALNDIWYARHRRDLEFSDARLRKVELNLASTVDLKTLPEPIDLVMHFAAVTHSYDPDVYWKVNHRGTLQLAEAVQLRGCRRFVYVSTRCATDGAGAYGESKLAAEEALRKLPWDRLLILRPSEVYGAGSEEGIDRFIALAQNWRIVPMLFGNSKIEFAPLHIEDFAAIVTRAVENQESGSSVIELCGPEDLSGPTLARRIAKRFGALPVPIWWPMLAWLIKAGLKIGAPDQAQRLTCAKTSTAATADANGQIRFLKDHGALT